MLNLNVDWDSVLGRPIALAFFMTNATNEKRFNYPISAFGTIGGEGDHLNQPRMFSLRLNTTSAIEAMAIGQGQRTADR